MFKEFIELIRQHGVIGLAFAVVIGEKLNALVSSIVDGFLMPLVLFFIPGGQWRQAILQIGPFHFLPGPILGSLVDFIIVASAIYVLTRFVFRMEIKPKP